MICIITQLRTVLYRRSKRQYKSTGKDIVYLEIANPNSIPENQGRLSSQTIAPIVQAVINKLICPSSTTWRVAIRERNKKKSNNPSISRISTLQSLNMSHTQIVAKIRFAIAQNRVACTHG